MLELRWNCNTAGSGSQLAAAHCNLVSSAEKPCFMLYLLYILCIYMTALTSALLEMSNGNC